MKKAIKLTLAVVLVMGATSLFAQKFGRINTQEIIMAMPETKTMQENMDTFAKELSDNIETMNVEFNTKLQDFQKNYNTFSDAIKEVKEKELNDMQTRTREFQERAQQDYQKKQNELLAPIKSTKGGVVNITGKFKSEGSVIGQIKSFEDNVTVKSYLSYSVTADLLGLMVIKKDEPMTVKVTRTILLLPEEAMRPRLADSRIGIFLTDMSRINGKKDKIEDFSVINRWNIQPKDMEAWKRGELVEPVKPIVFYLDDAFPALWREPIRRGVLRWNKAFEKIGFKNVMHIEDFPKDDPENCLYSPDVISFAREMGYYDGPDADFSFSDAYAPLDFGGMRACEARVWSFFRRVADGMDAYTDYAMGHNPANRMPLWVKPSKKVSPKEVFDAMRDHYEGTPMDMTRDLGAGGCGLPYRWRPMSFEVDGTEYVNERATATQQTGFWLVAQANRAAGDDLGILWFGVDDAATSCLTPIYCSIDRVPECLSENNGSMLKYSPTSMFWLFNRVTNFAYLRYDRMSKDLQAVADRWENRVLGEVREVTAEARKLEGEARVKYVTDYSVMMAQTLFDLWKQMDEYLLVKYIDGNVKGETEPGKFKDNGNGRDIPGEILFPGYDEKWQRAVAADNGETLKVIKN